MNAKPCAWEEGTPQRSTGWGQSEQLCGRDLEGSWTSGWAGSSNMSWQQGRPTASWAVATGVQSVGEVIIPICSAPVRPHLDTVFSFGPLKTRQTVVNWPVQWRATVRGLEHLPSGERLREQSLFSLRRRLCWGALIAAFPYLWQGHQEDGAWHFSVAQCGRTRGSKQKLKRERFTLGVRRNLLTLRRLRYWNRLSRGGCALSILGGFWGQIE